jgi:NAD(P)-dependent dehydrogenase (short-subunit alcohol dehydrogenase family)
MNLSYPKRLQDKVAIVTGSSRGIGKAIAFAFAGAGAKVAVTYRNNAAPAQAVVDEILRNGAEAFTFALDVCDREDVSGCFRSVAARYGNIDILVNNAGFLQQKPFHEITDEDWDTHLDINLKGVFICTQEISRYFQKQKSGTIINITSVGGQIGGAKAPHYAAAKSGVISFTKSSAKILAPDGVRVNAIAPGFIRTDMYEDIVSRTSAAEINSQILVGRVGEPEEVAAAAVFLASAEAAYITGHVLNVNGGLHLGAGS